MRFIFCLAAVAACFAVPADLAAQGAGPGDPQRVVATVNGKDLTVAGLKELMEGAPPQALQTAQSDPEEFLRWTQLMQSLAAEGEKLAEQSPYKDRLAWSREQILSMALIEQKSQGVSLSEAELRKAYEQSREKFGTATVRLIYAAGSKSPRGPGKAAAKAKIDKALAELEAGADFAAVAKKYSDDSESAGKGGEFGEIGAESKLAKTIRQQIFATTEGKWTRAFEQSAGYYVFQPVSFNIQPFEAVREQLAAETRKEALDNWMRMEREAVTAKIVNAEFFQALQQNSLRERAGLQPGTAAAEEVGPETVLAELNGKVLKGADIQGLLQAVSATVRTRAVDNPLEFLHTWGLQQRLSAAAEREGIHLRQPYKGRIAYDRWQILTQGRVDDYMNLLSLPPEEQRAAYDKQIDRFRSAKVRLLYVSYSLTPPPQTDPAAKKILNEEEAKQKMDGIVAEVRGGADFVTMVARHSEDAGSRRREGLGVIEAGDPRTPEPIKQAIFATKAGELTPVVKMPNGFYVFKVDEINTKSYEEVKNQVYDELRQKQFDEWFQGHRNKIQITIKDPDAFRQAAG